jgi:glucan endo-1,3-alpha-glucosidase
MVCFATYGENLAGYKRDIQDAQATGIDGFALNEGGWGTEAMYPRRTKLLFQAANELGTGFKLFFSLDFATLKMTYVPEIIHTYVNDPAYYRYNNRPVVSTFGGGGDWRTILDGYKAEGIDICFIPFFYPKPVTELPSYEVMQDMFAKWGGTVDGLFWFGATGGDEKLVEINTNYVKAAREAHKLVMSSYTPFYWGAYQPGRRFFETHGGFGVEKQWKSIIANQPDFVEIVTWNDFNESYITPVDIAGTYESVVKTPVRHPHVGYTELAKYFIQWYKIGKEPKIDHDKLVYIYRVHPKAATTAIAPPPADNTAAPPAPKPDPRIVARVTDQHGVEDNLYVTTLLKSPAELRVTTGGIETKYQAPKGYTSFAIPFNVGAQHFALYRKGKLLTEIDGEPIVAEPTEYNFFPTTGVATATN